MCTCEDIAPYYHTLGLRVGVSLEKVGQAYSKAIQELSGQAASYHAQIKNQKRIDRLTEALNKIRADLKKEPVIEAESAVEDNTILAVNPTTKKTYDMKDKWKCPKCGGIYKNTIQHCICGYASAEIKIIKLKEESNKKRIEDQRLKDGSSSAGICDKCGMEIAADNNYCANCGTKKLRSSSGFTDGISREGDKAPNISQSKARELVTASLQQSPNSIDQREKTSNKSGIAVKQKKSFSWKSFVAAFIIAFILNIFAAAASGGQPAKNIWWSVMWLYFSIEAWNYWRWKALLPYPLFVLVSTVLSLIMVGNNVEEIAWGYIVVNVLLNIGGLIVFYLLLRKTAKAALDKPA